MATDKTPHPIDTHVGAKVREARKRQKITQVELAKKCGIRHQQVQKYESGANRISASRLHEIADALDVSLLFFFAGTSPAFDWEYRLVEAWRQLSSEKRLIATNFVKAMVSKSDG